MGLGAGGYVMVGIVGLLGGAAYLTNVIGLGHPGNLISGGTLPITQRRRRIGGRGRVRAAGQGVPRPDRSHQRIRPVTRPRFRRGGLADRHRPVRGGHQPQPDPPGRLPVGGPVSHRRAHPGDRLRQRRPRPGVRQSVGSSRVRRSTPSCRPCPSPTSYSAPPCRRCCWPWPCRSTSGSAASTPTICARDATRAVVSAVAAPTVMVPLTVVVPLGAAAVLAGANRNIPAPARDVLAVGGGDDHTVLAAVALASRRTAGSSTGSAAGTPSTARSSASTTPSTRWAAPWRSWPGCWPWPRWSTPGGSSGPPAAAIRRWCWCSSPPASTSPGPATCSTCSSRSSWSRSPGSS